MVDVPNIPQRPNTPDPTPGNKKTVRSDEFRHLMQVSKTDPEQKKKKKQKRESEEDRKAEAVLAQTSRTLKKEAVDALHFKKETKVEKVGESEKRQKHEQKRPEEVTQEEKVEEATSPPPPSLYQPQEIQRDNDAKQVGSLPPDLPVPPPPTHLEEQKETQEKEEIEEQQQVSFTEKKGASLPPVEHKKNPTSLSTPPPSPASVEAPPFLSSSSPISSKYTPLDPKWEALFQKMAGVMSVMDQGGIQETTLHLNSSDLSSSLFAGAKITIKEFDTAPKVFNIEFSGSPEAVALFSQNTPALYSFFQKGQYRFRVQGIRSSLSTGSDSFLEGDKKVRKIQEDEKE